jgi:hypothetical protein
MTAAGVPYSRAILAARGVVIVSTPVQQTRHCEEPTDPASGRPDDRLRDEAIQLFPGEFMDCFASLAMTVEKYPS